MFQSISLKTQATRLGELLSQHGVQLSRSQKLEALAFVHGAANWQTLRAAMKAETPNDSAYPIVKTERGVYVFGSGSQNVLEPHASGPWTSIVGETGEEYMTLSEQSEQQIALRIFEAPLFTGEQPEFSVWAEHKDGSRRLLAVSLHSTPAEVPQLSVFPIKEDGLAHDPVIWAMQHDLSGSQGEFNRAQLERKPYLASSDFSVDLWNKCCELLTYGEGQYIGCLNGELGVYFEQEYMCQESECEPGEQPGAYPTFTERVLQLQRTHAELTVKHPEVRFAVSNEEELTWNGRPCVWAFLPAREATVEMTRRLHDDLFSLAYPH